MDSPSASIPWRCWSRCFMRPTVGPSHCNGLRTTSHRRGDPLRGGGAPPPVRRGAQGPPGRHAIDGYFAYSNFGASFSASFVAPGRTILPFSCLSLPTGTAISCSPRPSTPPTPTIA